MKEVRDEEAGRGNSSGGGGRGGGGGLNNFGGREAGKRGKFARS